MSGRDSALAQNNKEDFRVANRGGAEGAEKPNEDIILKKPSANYVLLSLKVFAGCANFPVAMLIVSIQKRSHRGGAEDAE